MFINCFFLEYYYKSSSMLYEKYLENLIIYGENLSFFYVLCAIVSFLAVWLTWSIEPKISSSRSKDSLFESASRIIHDESDSSFLSNKSNDRKALLKSIESSLSTDDKERELQIQQQQLMDILDLMKNDEKFNTITYEELEEQLKLYRD